MPDSVTLLVTVKAYPAISKRHGEVVCVAGIRTDLPQPTWVRLFPVPFRDLAFDQRFKKYQIITVNAARRGSDARPETLQPDPDSMVLGAVLPAAGNWAKRRAIVEPLLIPSMCWLQRKQQQDGTSLGVFRPYLIEDFVVEKDDTDWDPGQQTVASQASLFFPNRGKLEKIPYRFRYRWRCDDAQCNTHFQSIVDWEIAESFRSWTQRYDEPTLLVKLREKC